MQLDTKINKIKEELTPKEVKAEATKSNVHTEYDKLAVEYPDITTTESVLYKKMNDIYLKNSKLYANANQSSPNADPDQYRDLIERASIELKAEGVDIKKEQKNIRNKFASPEDQGYREPEKKGTEFTKQEVGMMVSQGINSKSLLADINKAVNQWGTTGIMVMED